MYTHTYIHAYTSFLSGNHTEYKNTTKDFLFKHSNYFNEAIDWLLSVALFIFDIYRCFWDTTYTETDVEFQ